MLESSKKIYVGNQTTKKPKTNNGCVKDILTFCSGEEHMAKNNLQGVCTNYPEMHHMVIKKKYVGNKKKDVR